MKIWIWICMLLAAACAPAAAFEPRALDPDTATPLSAAPADMQAFVAGFYSSTLQEDLTALDPALAPRGWSEDLDADGEAEWILAEPLYSGEDVQTAMILDRGADGWSIVYRETGPFLLRVDAAATGGWRDFTGVYNVASAPRGGYGMFRTRLAWNGAQYQETDPQLAYYRVTSGEPMPLYDAPGPRGVLEPFDLAEPGACVAATVEGDEQFAHAGEQWLAVNRPVPGYAPAGSLAPEPRCELAFAFSRMLFESAAGPFAAAEPGKPFEPTNELTAWLRRTLAPRVSLQSCNSADTESPREIAIHRVLDDLPFAVSRPFQDARSFFPYFAPAVLDSPEGAVAIRFRQYFSEVTKPVTWVFTTNPETLKYQIIQVRHACGIPVPKAAPHAEPETAQGEARPEKNRLEAWEEVPGGAPAPRDTEPKINFKELYPGGDDVIPQFFRALNERRFADAYAMLGPDLQSATPFQAFETEHAMRSEYAVSRLSVRHAGNNVFEAKFDLTAARGTGTLAFMGKARIASVGGRWIIASLDLLEMDW